MRWTKHLLGSIAVYLVVAACGSGGGGALSAGGTGGGGGGPEGGPAIGRDGSPGGAGPDEGGLLDALVNPEPDAIAAPGATVATEACSKTFVYQTTTFVYAEHAFPGKTKTDLTALSVSVHFTSSANPLVPPGYADQQSGAYVRDGYASVLCGAQSNPSIDGVTFILPP